MYFCLCSWYCPSLFHQKHSSMRARTWSVVFVFSIFLAALGLSCGMQDLWSSSHHTGSFGYSLRTLSCGMWDLVSWPGIKPRPPALGAWSLSHWTTRKAPCAFLSEHFDHLGWVGARQVPFIKTLMASSWGIWKTTSYLWDSTSMSFPLQGGKILKKLLSLLLMCPDLDATFKKNEIPEKNTTN